MVPNYDVGDKEEGGIKDDSGLNFWETYVVININMGKEDRRNSSRVNLDMLHLTGQLGNRWKGESGKWV